MVTELPEHGELGRLHWWAKTVPGVPPSLRPFHSPDGLISAASAVASTRFVKWINNRRGPSQHGALLLYLAKQLLSRLLSRAKRRLDTLDPLCAAEA